MTVDLSKKRMLTDDELHQVAFDMLKVGWADPEQEDLEKSLDWLAGPPDSIHQDSIDAVWALIKGATTTWTLSDGTTREHDAEG